MALLAPRVDRAARRAFVCGAAALTLHACGGGGSTQDPGAASRYAATLLVSETLLAQGLEIVRVERSGQMFGMLARGRVDAVVTLDIIGDREMAAQTQGYIEKLMPPVLIEDFHVPVSRQFYAANREFMESLWRLIGETREATYAELSPKYLF